MREVKTRIAAVDTAEYVIYRSSTTSSVRVGTKHAYTQYGTVIAQLSPVRDAVSLELYGDKINQMYTLTAEKGADIQVNDKLQHGNDLFQVVSVLLYSGHISATIERTGVL